MNGTFKGNIYCLPVRVYYEDTDFSGVVYHANYLKYAERGRSEFLHHCGIDHQELHDRACAFAVVDMDIKFHAPARISEELEVQTMFTKVVGARLYAVQKIFKAGDCIWSAHVTVACVSLDGHARRIPKDVAEKMKPYLA